LAPECLAIPSKMYCPDLRIGLFIALSQLVRSLQTLDAIGVTRQRCGRWDCVLEFHFVGPFKNIPYDLLLQAVRKHTNMKWVELYIERWLRAPIEYSDG